MTSNQFVLAVQNNRAASFWIQNAVAAASTRDVLDALRDAETLLRFCQMRAKECGLPVTINT